MFLTLLSAGILRSQHSLVPGMGFIYCVVFIYSLVLCGAAGFLPVSPHQHLSLTSVSLCLSLSLSVSLSPWYHTRCKL